MRILLAQFPWICCDCLQSNFDHWKIFESERIQRCYCKNSLLITHAGMYIWIWYWMRQCTKDSNFRMMNSLMAYCGVCLTWLDGKYQSKLIEYSFCFNCEYNNFTNILKNVTETLTLFQTVMSKKWNQD